MPHRQIDIQSTPGRLPITWPMGLTMLRLALLPVFLWFLLNDAHEPTHSHRWITIGIFAIMAITDKLDGYLARKFNQVSKIGTILDPVADKLLVACSVILLSIVWVAPHGYRIPMKVVVAVYGKDLVVALGTLALLYLIGKVSIIPRWPGKIGTFLQLALVIATLLAPDFEKLSIDFAWWLTRSLWWSVIVVSTVACADYVMVGVRQLRAGRKRPIY